MNDTKSIGFGSATFVVKDKSITKWYESKIYEWLQKEGFEKWIYNPGHDPRLDWVFINVNSKIYSNAKNGVMITEPVLRCKITWEEFLVIYGILKSAQEEQRMEMERITGGYNESSYR